MKLFFCRYYKRFIKNFKREKCRYNIDDKFTDRLIYTIYSWNVDSDFLLLKFMCHKGYFREYRFEKLYCIKSTPTRKSQPIPKRNKTLISFLYKIKFNKK